VTPFDSEDEAQDAAASGGTPAAADREDPAEREDGAEREDALMPVAGRLALIVGRINRRIRPSSGGLSHGMLSALATVVRRGPIKAGELARIEVISAPSLTRALADLESRELVSRKVDESDRRSFYIVATPAGRELVLQATSERARLVAHLLAEVGPEELTRIEQTLDALEAVANAPSSS
jgi:DNA-binding MarR family transcriptional regulator